MKNKSMRAAAAAVLSGILITASGCGVSGMATETSTTATSANETTSANGSATDAYARDGEADAGSGSEGTASASGNGSSVTVTAATDSTAVTADMINIKDSDYETDWEAESYVTITASGTAASADGNGVEISDGAIRITEEGTYVLTGTLEGTVTVDTGDEDAKVRLVLNGFSVTSSDGPAILALTADKVTITTAEGTENSVTDSGTYSNADYDAVIMSKTDLVLNGGGTLTVTGNYKDAVHSTDDLRITGGTYEATSVDDGFVGKDRLEITDGTFTVTTTGENGDAFKSTNEEDEDKGFIYIAGGTFNITSGDEGFQSAADLLVVGGTFSINANGKGFHADDTLEFEGGNVTIAASYEGLEAPVIVIGDGVFDITASDDGINAAGGGTTSEDSENESGTGDGPGNNWMGGMQSNSTGYLYINGGTIHVNASGDGIDSNTNITQTGGEITVDGPTADMDGALDYDDSYEMSGGTLFAVGSSGMLQAISDSSSVNCLTVIYSSAQAAGTTITIRDADGNTIAEYTPEKQYASFVFASEALEDGATYTVLSNGSEVCTVTLSGTVTMVDDSGNATTAGWGGGFGGWGMRGGSDGGNNGRGGRV